MTFLSVFRRAHPDHAGRRRCTLPLAMSALACLTLATCTKSPPASVAAEVNGRPITYAAHVRPIALRLRGAT